MNSLDIFYADDDDDDLMFFEDAINEILNKTETLIYLHIIKNGENLLDKLKWNTNRNKVLFLDINMPYKTGFEFLNEIRNDSKAADLPVIIFSTSAKEDDILKSKILGANYYAVKPNNFNNLVKLIEKFVSINWVHHKTDINDFVQK